MLHDAVRTDYKCKTGEKGGGQPAAQKFDFNNSDDCNAFFRLMGFNEKL